MTSEWQESNRKCSDCSVLMHSVSQAGGVQHTFGVGTAVLDVAITVLRQEQSASLL